MDESSLPTNEVTQNEARQRTVSRDSSFKRYQNYQGVWMEQMRGNLMLVATVIATMTFQTAINPPGRVWQSNTNSTQGCAAGELCKAGTSVLGFGDSQHHQKLKYEIFILLCTISFSASQSIILLLICGFSLRNRLIMWLLMIAMFISVICTAGAYIISIWMVMQPLDTTVSIIIRVYAVFWAGLAALLLLVLFCRLLLWLLEELFRFLCCCD